MFCFNFSDAVAVWYCTTFMACFMVIVFIDDLDFCTCFPLCDANLPEFLHFTCNSWPRIISSKSLLWWRKFVQSFGMALSYIIPSYFLLHDQVYKVHGWVVKFEIALQSFIVDKHSSRCLLQSVLLYDLVDAKSKNIAKNNWLMHSWLGL